MSDNIYKRVANYIEGIFSEYPHPNLVYHNLEHTKGVVSRAQEIAAHYQLSESDTLTLYIAAWFHDIGHIFADLARHEEKSVEMMKEFMAKENITDQTLINNVAACIMATHMPHDPKNQLQEILCDADTYHFGTKDFRKTNKKIRKEFIMRNYIPITLEWDRNTLEMLEKHTFHTSYCQVLLDDGKRENVERLRKKLMKNTVANNSNALFPTELNDVKQAKQKSSLLARGIQTMLRLTSQNHLDLSEMADRKANILISVNSIIISVILSVLVRRLETDPYLTVPAIVFLTTSLITIIISILATRPKVTEGSFSREEVISRKTNLLFFGNFYKSTLEEFEWAMSTIMQDQDYLYGVLIKDIHQLGVILARKYKLIRLAYNVFMVGITLSVVTFSVAAILNYSNATPSSVVSEAAGSPF